MKANNMTIKMTNINKAGFTVSLLAILLGFVSCKNPFSDTISRKADNNTYLMICEGDVSISSRTINPSETYALENLTDVYLYALKTKDVNGNSVSVSERVLAGSASLKLSDLYTKQLLLEDGAGEYTIRMRATLDGVYFHKRLENVQITANVTNPVSIALEPVKSSSNLNTPFDEYGGFSFTINADIGTANVDVDSIYVTLKHLESDEIVEQRYINRKTTSPQLSSKTVYEHLANKSETQTSGRVPAGTYRITFDFLALDQSLNQDIVINSYSFIMNVLKGRNTYYEETFELNKVYTITYNDDGGTPAPGETKYSKFTNFKRPALPQMEKAGYTFKGWYSDEHFASETGPLYYVPENFNTNIILYAKFEQSALYVDYTNGDDTKHNGTGKTDELKTLGAAISKIKASTDHKLDWQIYIYGDYPVPYEISNEVCGYANTITLLGGNGNGNDSITSDDDSVPALEINASTDSNNFVPVKIKNLRITGGVMVDMGSKLYVSGVTVLDKLCVDDVYQYYKDCDNDAAIYLADNLSTGSSITIWPQYYDAPYESYSEVYKQRYVYTVSEDKIKISDNKGFFHVNPEAGSSKNWYIDNDGCLNYDCTVSFTGEEITTDDYPPVTVSCCSLIKSDNTKFRAPTKTGYLFAGWCYKAQISANPDYPEYDARLFEFESEYVGEGTYIEDDIVLMPTWIYDSDALYVDTADGIDLIYFDDTEDKILFGDCSQGKPFGSIMGALEAIRMLNKPTRDYTIKISGVCEQYNIEIDDTVPAKSITLEGVTGENADGVKRSGKPDGFDSIFKISGDVNVKFKNIKISISPQGYNNKDGIAINVGAGSTVTLDDGAVLEGIFGPDSLNQNGIVAVENGGSFVMNAGSQIKDFVMNHGVVYVKAGGTFTMNGGTITGNESPDANIFVNGTFLMEGGSITNNTQDGRYNQNGAVYVANGASFIMKNGTISNNTCYALNENWTSTRGGGGVRVSAGGTFTMEGGTITGNKVLKKSSYNGSVSDAPNSPAYGGGVCIEASGTSVGSFTMTGGTISGNTADTAGNGIGFIGSLNEGKTGTIYLGKDALITDNDIYLPSFMTITIVEEITGDIQNPIKATITPQEYKANQTILEAGNNVTLEYEYDYFGVTPEGSTTWAIDENGKLVKSGTEIDPYTDPNSYTQITGGTIEQVTGGGSIENESNNENTIITIPTLYVGKSLVTQAEYEKYMTYYGTNTPTEAEEEKDNKPAYYVSWIDAIIYCNLRSIAENKVPVYSMNGKTNPAEWTVYSVDTVTEDNKVYYYYNSNADDYSWDSDSSFDFDLSVDGYRLMTSAECRYISENNSELFTGSSMDEWTQTYSAGYEAQRLYYSYSDRTCVEKMKGNATREQNLGFRVVHNLPSNP